MTDPTPVDPPAPEDPPTEPADPTPEPTPDPTDEVAKWKAMSRKHEAEAKANKAAAQRLQEIEDAAKSQADKDAEAKVAAEQRATAAETALARMKVATEKGLPSELAEVLQGATEAEMAEHADRLLKVVNPSTPPPPGSADGGPQGKGDPNKPKQLTQADIKAMEPDAIVAAKAAGQLNELLGIT